MTVSYTKTRLATYSSSFLQAISVNVPPVLFVIFQDHYGITYGQLANLILLTFVLQIAVDYLLSKTSHLFKPRSLLLSVGVTTLIGYILMTLAPLLFPNHVYVGLLLAVTFYATGSGINEVMSSPLMDAIPSKDKGSSMAFLHSFYCWGQLVAVLVSTLLLRLLGERLWYLIMAFWCIVPLLNIYLYATCPFPDMVTGHEEGGVRLNRIALYWVALFVMIASGASEVGMAQWASLFAQKGLGVSKTLGDLMGPCFFALLMGMGRLFYGIRGEKINMTKALVFSGILCVMSYLITVFSPWPLLSLFGVGLCGLSVSLMWPGTLVLSAKAIPSGGTKLFAMLALGGDIGCSLGPWLTGIISGAVSERGLASGLFASLSTDQRALRIGLLAGIVFPVMLSLLVPRLSSKNRKEVSHE